VLFNTCSIRDKAHHKGVSSLGALEKAKAARPDLMIGFTGCVAQHDGANVLKRFPFLNFVIGTDNIDSLPEAVYRAENGDSGLLMVGFDPSQDYSIETKITPGKKSAFVNIMKGCDNFCTYCIVPFTRGREKSRTVEEVVPDIERLLRQGVHEVTLLGQNVNSYGKSLGGRAAGQTFARLLREIEAMADRLEAEGLRSLKRLRYTTSHPKDFDQEMIDVHGELKRLVPHLHLPVQSGSPDVLRAMKRYLPIEEYIGRVEAVREKVPGISITSDMIVGFPTETEADFQATLDLVRKVRFDGVYAYTYSPRPGTQAIKLGDPIPEKEKKERLFQLQDLQYQIQNETNLTWIGREVEVLVEGPSKRDTEMATGRTPEWKIVNFPRPADVKSVYDMVGEYRQVKIESHTAFAFKGTAVPL
jgi:tRNA-2-methylthio-N6-dimethylallyladenosine synthase